MNDVTSFLQHSARHRAVTATSEISDSGREQGGKGKRQSNQVSCQYFMFLSFDQVLNLASDVLKHVPELIDYESTYKLICDDMSPLNVVLLQEVWV